MVWENNITTGILDTDGKRVLFTLPCTYDNIKNWKELGRTGAMVCCSRPNVRKDWVSFRMNFIGEDYNLSLGKRGLRRRISSSVSDKVKQGILQGIGVIEIRYRDVADGDYKDFQRIGEYAIQRFPFIASELTAGLRGKLEHNIWYPSNEVEKVEQQLKDDWKFYQAEVSRAFYNTFCKTIIAREDLIAEQTKELITLVFPLNVKAEDKRYNNIVLYNPEID